jgi:hypothetical protein
MGAFTLLTTTLFSCTADEDVTTDKDTELATTKIVATKGPGDQPIYVPPPK